MDTYVKRVEAMQINTIADARKAVEMIPNATLIRWDSKVEGLTIPGHVKGYGQVLFGEWVVQVANGYWRRADNMDGWELEDAT